MLSINFQFSIALSPGYEGTGSHNLGLSIKGVGGVYQSVTVCEWEGGLNITYDVTHILYFIIIHIKAEILV